MLRSLAIVLAIAVGLMPPAIAQQLTEQEAWGIGKKKLDEYNRACPQLRGHARPKTLRASARVTQKMRFWLGRWASLLDERQLRRGKLTVTRTTRAILPYSKKWW